MNAVKKEMEQVVTRILEDWGLMLVEKVEPNSESFPEGQEFYVAWLGFRGIVSGRYCVVCQQPFARALSSNLLGGAGDEPGEAEYQDALKEMVNVMSGNLLTSSYGEHTTFDLTSPTVGKFPSQELAALFNNFTMCFRADDEPVAVTFIPEEVYSAD
jgi:CheY-specific phosphatase CheX